MTSRMTKTATTLTEALDTQRALDAQAPDETIPTPAPQVAEIVPSTSPLLTLNLSLEELASIAASIQLCVHVHAISAPSALNVANSVLRKIHDAKVELAKRLP